MEGGSGGIRGIGVSRFDGKKIASYRWIHGWVREKVYFEVSLFQNKSDRK